MSVHSRLIKFAACAGIFAVFAVMLSPSAGVAAAKPQEQAGTTLAAEIADAKLLGKGVIEAYSKGGKTLLLLPKKVFGRLFVWYAEFVSVPSGVVSKLPIGGNTISFQHRGDRVFVRNLTATFSKRVAGRQQPRPGQRQGYEINPIELSVRRANEPPVMAVLPVVAADEQGGVLVDITGLFANDIETMSARALVKQTGFAPLSVNRNASYITSVRVFANNFGIRSHLTFVTKKNPLDPTELPRGVSLRVGHSIVMLPETPMPARRYDPRVGFFYTGASVLAYDTFTEYETPGGNLEKPGAVVMRYRLRKKNPDAPVSDPVDPIIFYLGREVPDRWRQAIKTGIEMWRPVFRAAGFSNAIIARDAPSFKDDPGWTPEDARFSTIRWLAQPNPNARGPHIVDPRSGEILSSHVEVWPQVISVFSRYYFAVNSALDKRANSLPLSKDLQDQLLAYVVAHEVGHAIGLRHNHIASTAFTVKQMRDPAFANKWGANASIMAYGRFNQAAQPGDGITKFVPGVGPYDYFAIRWGYRVFGKIPVIEQSNLDQMAAKAQSDRRLLWAASEAADEQNIWNLDPRVLTENTGADRVEATRLGVANILRSLKNLPDAASDKTVYSTAFGQFQVHHMTFLKSVARLLAGVQAAPWAKSGLKSQVVPAAKQREAVVYLLGEGARTLDAYKSPQFASNASIFGVEEVIDAHLASLVAELLQGPKLALLKAQKASDPEAYGVIDLAEDMHKSLWGDLTAAPSWRRALQRAHLDRIVGLFKAEKNANAQLREKVKTGLTNQGYSTAFAAYATASGTNTVFLSWARRELPKLAQRLEEAANKAKATGDRHHFLAMAVLARRVVQSVRPQQ